MTRISVLATVGSIILALSLQNLATAQTGRSGIVGHVSDSAGAVVQHARVELQPGGTVVTTSESGDFTIPDLIPGDYALSVSYVGFSVFSTRIRVGAGEPVRVNAVLQLGTQNESVTVHADRQGGEAEALDIERTADNIVQVLPADVITSLPNTNIADALGRLPSVSLERDEGEGKYVQIRGTEPRLSNVTVNGIHLPSPEGVRNVKLDAIPADLVESVEINKTLSANQDADAIGGSVNLVTKTPTDQPYVSLLGMGGYTPISGGRQLHQFAGTAGQRFGADKRFGALFGFSYDYNGRGIDDLEPAYPSDTSLFGVWAPNTEDIRNYHYDRSRYGFDGELDYKLKEMSSIYLRGFFSHFNDNGEDWIYSPSVNVAANPNTCNPTGPPASSFNGLTGCGGMGFTDVYRNPGQQLFSVQAGARHLFGKTVLTYELALSQAKYEGGFPRASFDGPGANDNRVAFGVDIANPFIPKFPVLNGVNIYDPTTYLLSGASTEKDSIFERDAVGDIAVNRQYSVASHAGAIEVGFKGWDARKSAIYDRESFDQAGGQPMNQFLSSFADHNYYFRNFTYGPVTQFSKILAAVQPGGTTPDLIYNLQNDFGITERIWAGYVMNAISFGHLRVQTGVRVESTGDELRANKVNLDTSGNFSSVSPLATSNSYIDVFPSVQAQYAFGADTILRAAYGMGIARPNFSDLAPYFIDDPTSNPEFARGNPDLKPTHAQNFDLLLEKYFRSVGIIQGGIFYKALTDPIYNVTVPFGTSATESTLINGPNAHIFGFEAAWQQRLTFLPGALNGMGVSANYGHTASRASFPRLSGERTDHPTLLRTAPNNWNFDVTYDKKGLSARMGLSHNDANLWFYGGSNAKDPSGDTYLLPHTQVDAQVSWWLPHGHGLQAILSGLNLNNEVFGFYNGAERYPIQREYYSRTISAGLRWTLGGEPH
jgi:TonB-dependent receptor